MLKWFFALSFLVISFSAWSGAAEFQVWLKDEKPASEILKPTPVPALVDKCACVQAYKTQVLAGDAKAIEKVSDCFSPTEENGCTKDEANYVAWVKAAATRGRVFPQMTLGQLYDFGAGVSKNNSLAADWYAQAARQNLPAGFLMLGRAYHYGAGRTRSDTKAMGLYQAALDGGLTEDAQRMIDNLKKEKQSK